MKFELCKLVNNICDSLNLKSIEEGENSKDVFDFLEWMNFKATLVFRNTEIEIPKRWLQSEITEFQYNKLKQQLGSDSMEIIDSYYIKKSFKEKTIYVLDNAKEPNNVEKLTICNILTFQKKQVVWVYFGYNVGSEFKGKHPALILKNVGDNLLVVPLSSQDLDETKDYIVKVKKENVFDLPKKDRWANIHRILPISIKRIDFTSPHGNVKKKVIDDILDAIKLAGIN